MAVNNDLYNLQVTAKKQNKKKLQNINTNTKKQNKKQKTKKPQQNNNTNQNKNKLKKINNLHCSNTLPVSINVCLPLHLLISQGEKYISNRPHLIRVYNP